MSKLLICGVVVAVGAFSVAGYQHALEKRTESAQEEKRKEELREKIARNAALLISDEYAREDIKNTRKRISFLEMQVSKASTPGETALAIEDLRAAKAELKEYEAKLNEGVE